MGRTLQLFKKGARQGNRVSAAGGDAPLVPPKLTAEGLGPNGARRRPLRPGLGG